MITISEKVFSILYILKNYAIVHIITLNSQLSTLNSQSSTFNSQLLILNLLSSRFVNQFLHLLVKVAVGEELFDVNVHAIAPVVLRDRRNVDALGVGVG